MKVLPWKSKIPDCSSYISPPAVLKPIHFSLPRLNHRINRALGKFETLTTTTFYRLTTAANDLFFFKWKQIEPEFIPLCDSNDPFHVDLVRLIHQWDPMVQYLELWGRALLLVLNNVLTFIGWLSEQRHCTHKDVIPNLERSSLVVETF